MSESGEPLSVPKGYAAKAEPTLALRVTKPDGTELKVHVGHDGGPQQQSAEIRDDGTVLVRIEGTGYPGRIDELPVCKILVDRLNEDGRKWTEPRVWPESEREAGVDVVAEHLDGGTPLKFQVTRLDPDPNLWKELADNGVVEKVYESVDAAADALKAAISKKSLKPQEGITLVLDGIQLPLGLQPIRDSFTTRHGEWLRKEFQFRHVWVVEPVIHPAWTFRLS